MKPTKRTLPITTLFLDVGGVLLTDGWGHRARRRAARAFDLVWDDMEARHAVTFETYEQGKLTLEEYLDPIVFYATVLPGAGALGIRGLVHVNASSTRAELALLGLPLSGATQKA